MRAALLATLLAACAAEEVPEDYGENLGTEENPIPADDESYAVITKIDFTTTGDMPAQVTAAVATVKSFATNPARTLLSVANQTTVQQLKASLSATLNNQLEGWINAEIDKARIATKTVRQVATDIVAITQTSLTQFYLESTLLMTPAKTTHMLGGLNFRPSSIDIVVPLGGLTGDALTQYPVLAVAEAGAITLSAHKFGIAFGDHAWSGINLATTTLYGSGVQATLTAGINCSALATAVAAKCASGACVGHASELRAICDGGTAALLDSLRTPVTAIELDLFRFVAGTARLVDDTHDGLAERIVDGTWDAEMSSGSGVHKTSATFTAKREK